MNANVSKTNTGKILAAILVFTMVFAGATILFSEESNAASDNTQQYSGTVDGVQTLYNNVVINDKLTVTTNGVLIIEGNLTVNDGVDVTIQNGGQLIVKGKLVTINGDVTVTGNGTNENYDFENDVWKPTESSVEWEPTKTTGESAIRIAGSTTVPTFKDSGIIVNGSITVTRNAVFDVTGDGSGYILVNNGGTVAITKVGSNIGTIDGVHIYLAVGGTFQYNGRTTSTTATVTVSTYGTGAVYTTASAVISNSVAADNLKSPSATSDLTFTNTNRTFTGYYYDSTKQEAVTQSIREYALDISGTVANFDKISISGAVVKAENDNNIYFTSEAAAEQFNGIAGTIGTNPYYYDDKVMGTAIVSGTLTVDETATFVVSGSDKIALVSVTGTLNLNETTEDDIKSATKDSAVPGGMEIGKLISVEGVLEISGTAKANGANINSAVFGTIAMNGGTLEIADFDKYTSGTIGFYGAYYEDETEHVAYFGDLSAAVSGAAAAGIQEVYVYGTYGSQDVTKDGYGSYIVSSDITIPEGISLTIGSGLIINEGATMTVSSGVYINFDEGAVFVDGKLVDQSLEFEAYETTAMSFEVKSVSADELTNTYTSLAIALRETTSGTIYLYSEVDIDGIMTINENVTVQYADDSDLSDANKNAGIGFKDEDAELIINGTLFIDGKHTLTTAVTGKPTEYGTVTVNNVIMYDGDGITGNIAGAYFTAEIGDLDPYSYITSVAYAAQNSVSVNDVITIKGNLSVGDVTFTQGDDADEGLKVEVKAYDATRDVLTAGTVTLVGDVNLVLTNMFTGTVQSEVTAGTSALQFNKASGAQIDFAVDNSGDSETTTMVFAQDLATTKIVNGTVTVSTGTVYVGVIGDVETTNVKNLTVAGGATLVVAEEATLYAHIWGYDIKKIPGQLPVFTEESIAGAVCLTIDGTLTVEKGATLNADLAQVNGTLNNNGSLSLIGAQVSGAINFAEDDDSAVITALIVDGAVSGEYTTQYTVALAGADMANAIINPDAYHETSAESTVYFINGAEFATVYAPETITIPGVTGLTGAPIETILLFADVDGVKNETAKIYSDESENNLIFEMTDDINKTIEGIISGIKNGSSITNDLATLLGALSSDVVGDYENVYITMEPADVSGTITVYQGMDLYIDGKSISNFAQYDSENRVTYVLPVGQHTYAIQVDPGLTGTPVITLDGETITGGTFTISQDAKTFQIVVTGDISQDVPVVDGGSSDGMGLTDYLLIILVVLIVIMAIMVAMRLMRS